MRLVQIQVSDVIVVHPRPTATRVPATMPLIVTDFAVEVLELMNKTSMKTIYIEAHRAYRDPEPARWSFVKALRHDTPYRFYLQRASPAVETALEDGHAPWRLMVQPIGPYGDVAQGSLWRGGSPPPALSRRAPAASAREGLRHSSSLWRVVGGSPAR